MSGKVKLKTKKCIASRFKVTGSGKLKFRPPGMRHIKTKMTAKSKRQLKNAQIVSKAHEKTYKVAMCVN